MKFHLDGKIIRWPDGSCRPANDVELELFEENEQLKKVAILAARVVKEASINQSPAVDALDFHLANELPDSVWNEIYKEVWQ